MLKTVYQIVPLVPIEREALNRLNMFVSKQVRNKRKGKEKQKAQENSREIFTIKFISKNF